MYISADKVRDLKRRTFEKLVNHGVVPSNHQVDMILEHTGYDPDYAIEAYQELSAADWRAKCTCECHTSKGMVMHMVPCC